MSFQHKYGDHGCILLSWQRTEENGNTHEMLLFFQSLRTERRTSKGNLCDEGKAHSDEGPSALQVYKKQKDNKRARRRRPTTAHTRRPSTQARSYREPYAPRPAETAKLRVPPAEHMGRPSSIRDDVYFLFPFYFFFSVFLCPFFVFLFFCVFRFSVPFYFFVFSFFLFSFFAFFKFIFCFLFCLVSFLVSIFK